MTHKRIRSIYASDEELRSSVASMGTVALANFMQNLAEEKRNLKGKIKYDKKNKRAYKAYSRLIRICSAEMNNRQMEMF